MPPIERPTLRVEGKDDKYVISHLLNRHGIDPESINISFSRDGHKDTGGRDSLLKGMRILVAASTGRSVGFVLDSDDDATDRWRAVRKRLDGLGLSLPVRVPVGGFVGNAPKVKARVGVWLIPDNRTSGAIEEFLQKLVSDDDALLQHADESTQEALRLGGSFPESQRQKAVLHAWLAWQRRPGLPYGLAIRTTISNTTAPPPWRS